MVLNQEKCMSRKKKMMQKITRDLNINYIKTNKFKTITLYFIYSNTYDFKEDMGNFNSQKNEVDTYFSIPSTKYN